MRVRVRSKLITQTRNTNSDDEWAGYGRMSIKASKSVKAAYCTAIAA